MELHGILKMLTINGMITKLKEQMLSLLIQWQASDDVRATVDYTHSKRDFFGDRQSVGIWFVGGGNVAMQLLMKMVHYNCY